MSELISLIYASTATLHLHRDELAELLEQARTYNIAADITGFLIYRSGNILQALEGPAPAVKALFAKIAKDTRHHSIEVLLEEPIPARQFAGWPMGFGNLDEIDPATMPGFVEFLQKNMADADFQQNPRRASILLLKFKEYME